MNSDLCPLSDIEPIHIVPGISPAVAKVLVFVHGIRSSHETFQPLATKLRAEGVDLEFRFAYFDYNYRRSIPENGKTFAATLKAIFQSSNSEVTIVGHSMGGLVARFALLQHGHEMPFVKRLFMLGTPNHGTLHTGRLGLLSSLTREATGSIWALTTAKTGVLELTAIDKLLDVHLNTDTASRTHHVDYISIPATCFHEGASWLQLMRASQSRGIGAAPLAMELFLAHPSTRVRLQIPHDGIVEETSVSMGLRGDPTRRSERRKTCEGRPNRGPYLHIRHDDYRKESHVTIQSADRTASIMAGILKSASLSEWRQANQDVEEFTFEPQQA